MNFIFLSVTKVGIQQTPPSSPPIARVRILFVSVFSIVIPVVCLFAGNALLPSVPCMYSMHHLLPRINHDKTSKSTPHTPGPAASPVPMTSSSSVCCNLVTIVVHGVEVAVPLLGTTPPSIIYPYLARLYFWRLSVFWAISINPSLASLSGKCAMASMALSA